MASGSFVATKPTCAAPLNADEYHRRLPLQTEPAAGWQVVKMQHWSILRTSIISAKRLLNAATKHARQRNTRSITRDKRPHLVGEVTQPLGEQPRIFRLPFMPVRLHITVFQVRLKVRRLVEEHQKKVARVEVTVDRHLVELMTFLRPAIVAILRAPLTGDMKMYLIVVQIVVHPLHRLRRQVVPKYGSVSLVGGQNCLLSECWAVTIAFLVAVHMLVRTAGRTDNAGKHQQQQYSQDVLFHFSVCFFAVSVTFKQPVYCPAAQKRALTVSREMKFICRY